jgi:hypothetical protein
MTTSALTKREAVNAITAIWGYGRNLRSDQFDTLDEHLPPSDLPILDRLLDNCGLLDAYNKSGRPAFTEFRQWWAWKPTSRNSDNRKETNQ